MKEPHWKLPDIIDLEFFLDQDDDTPLEDLIERDRAIYAQLHSAAGKDLTPSHLLYGWLAEQRKHAASPVGEAALPGRIWREIFVLFFWGMLVAGLTSGATLALSFLSYGGARPVNVSAYFGLFVVFEVVLFCLLMAMSAYRKLLGKGLESSFLYSLLRRFFYKMMGKLIHQATTRVTAEKSIRWSSFSSSMHKLHQRYGSLFMRPFFLLFQLFGVCFNAGVLAATLLKVIGSDVAFGWQTTLQVNSHTVYLLVKFISLPWRWLGSGYCCPEPAQIEGSRLILKDGIYHLATPDLASWWPFLCMAVFFYALLPRLVLFITGIFQQRSELDNLPFNYGRYRQLLHRMQTPVLATGAATEEQIEPTRPDNRKNQPNTSVAPPPSSPPQPAIETTPPATPSTPSVVALVSEELADQLTKDDLSRIIQHRLGYTIADFMTIWTLEMSSQEEIEAITAVMASRQDTDVLLLQEAWQPPIQEFLSFLVSLRQALGEQPIFIIGLIGKPDPETIFTPVTPVHYQTWKQKTATLADPGVQLVELVQ